MALLLALACAAPVGGELPVSWDGSDTVFAFVDARIGVAARARADTGVLDTITVLHASSEPLTCEDLNIEWPQGGDPRARLAGLSRALPGAQELVFMAGFNWGERWDAGHGGGNFADAEDYEPGEGAVPNVIPVGEGGNSADSSYASSLYLSRSEADCSTDLREAATGFSAMDELFEPQPPDDDNGTMQDLSEMIPILEPGERATFALRQVTGSGVEVDGTVEAEWCGAWMVEEVPTHLDEVGCE